MSGITPFPQIYKPPKYTILILIGYELMEEQDFDFNIGFGTWRPSIMLLLVYGNRSSRGNILRWNCTSATWIAKYTPRCFQWHTGNDNTGGTIEAVLMEDTTLTSPVYDLTDYTNPTFTYHRWYTNSPPTGQIPQQIGV